MKMLKDPIYGYINIEEYLIKTVIDTPTFQRLRNIIQTSYVPLYPSAVHNRFVHSLGVYHLAKIASKAIKKTNDKILCYIEKEKLEEMLQVFEYASLLHDVGHSPFSHTGEAFYLEDGSRDSLHKTVIDLTNDKTLESDIKQRNYTAAPHELMSVIVALKTFQELFDSDEKKSFFARCILGYSFVEPTEMKEKIGNKIISLLNSSVIDVDKLDYLIRDAFITGFDTISIDYFRLLNSIEISVDNEICELVFLKSGLSVIENVVYAHDSERKWIQNHPVIVYESNLLKIAIETINKQYDVFNYDALTYDGKELMTNGNDFFCVKLLCDADIIFLMKNIQSGWIDEYFDRGKRRRPLWKSESEYKAIFNQGFSGNLYKILEDSFDELLKYLNTINSSLAINDNIIGQVKEDILKNEQLISDYPEKKTLFDSQIKTKSKNLELLECLKRFSDVEGLSFDFVILKANQFTSGFSKSAFGDLKIKFPGVANAVVFREVTNVLSGFKSDRDKFYYIYYKKGEDNKRFNINVLAKELGRFAMEETYR